MHVETIINAFPQHTEYGWRLTLVWIYEDGSFGLCDTDGNHEPVMPADLPTAAETTQMWREYLTEVAQTGEDPLHQINVPRHRSRKESWTVTIRRSILGVLLCTARRGRKGPHLTGASIPAHVQRFCDVKPNLIGRPGKPLVTDMDALPEGLNRNGRIRTVIDNDIPRTEGAIQHDTRMRAIQALRRLNASV